MENSNHNPYFVPTNPPQVIRMGMVMNQQNFASDSVRPQNFFINQAPDILLNNTNGRFRLRWTRELHALFLKAVHRLGGAFNATPKKIQLAMNVDGLTHRQVKSHLQKFRKGLVSGRLLKNRRFRKRLSDGSGSPNCTLASISNKEAAPLDVPAYYKDNQVHIRAEDEEVMQLAFGNATHSTQLPNYYEAINSLPPVAISSIDEHLGDFDQWDVLKTNTVVPSSEPLQHQVGSSYEEVVQALPPITPSPNENYLKAFRQSGDWAMEYLLSVNIDESWHF